MIEYTHLMLLYKSARIRTVRLLVLFFLVVLLVSQIAAGVFPTFPLFFLSLFAMWEIFYHFHISFLRPTHTLSENLGDPLLASTKQAVELFLSSPTGIHLLNKMLGKKNILYFLSKLNIAPQEITAVDIQKPELLTQATSIAKQTGGNYITTIDLLVAYLLFTQPSRKLLFNKEIKPDELLEFVSWTRKWFDDQELPRPLRIHFSGEGLGEPLITGWTPLTKQFTADWTWKALASKRYTYGREEEYKQFHEALTKKENNNVLLVGEAGVGKETLVSALVHDSYQGILTESLNHKRLLELRMGALLAGADNQGALEERLATIIAEVSHASNVILYVPQFQNALGSSDFHLNLSGVLLPYLKEGKLPIIASMTSGEFKTYLEKNPLLEVFTVIKLSPPDEKIALQMVFDKTSEIEATYRCVLTCKAVLAAVKHAKTFLPDEVLPGSAVQLLSETANTVSQQKKGMIITEDHVVATVERKTNVAVGAPKEEEKQLLLHLEEKIHERVVNQTDAVGAIAEAMRRVRSGLAQSNKPISFLFLGPTGVGKTETAKALAEIYFRGEKNMIRLDMSEYADTEGVKRLLGAPPGEGNERGELTDKIHDNPYSLVLLDEFEKAHPSILDLFLQILEDGRLTDNKGRTVSFNNAIIIATSNAASEFIRERVNKGGAIDKAFQQELLEYLQTHHVFKPELLNRFDGMVTFKPLGPREIQEIVRFLLERLVVKMKEQDITLSIGNEVIEKIAKDGYDPQFGARPLRRYIQDNVEDRLAKMELEDSLKRGATASLSVDPTGVITVAVG